MATHKLSILVEALGASKAAKDLKGVDASLSHIGSRTGHGVRELGTSLRGIATSTAGIIGITGAAFGLEKVIEDSVGKAQEFGTEVAKIQAITGLSAESVSALAAAMEHFGIESDAAVRTAGMLEKNLGNLTKDRKTAAKFEKQYGFALLDTNGHVKDANTLILQTADYFNNKNIPAQTKAAALAKIYGKNWQQMVPFLKAGSKGIKDAEDEAKRLGLTLTQDNIDALKKNKQATREWNTALGGLELQIGLKLLPRITDLATAATSFVSSHGKEISQFFQDAATFAGQLGGAIHDDVLPVIKGIGDAWGALPDGLKKLLIAGFVVNKLSGGAITGIASDLGKGLIKGVLGMNAGVVNLKAGVVNGGGGPAAPGGGEPGPKGPGLVSTAAVVLSAAAVGQIGYQVSESLKGPIVQAFKDAFPDSANNGGGDFVNSALTSIQNQFLPGFDALNHLNDVHLENIPTELGRIADFLTGHHDTGLTGHGGPGRGNVVTGEPRPVGEHAGESLSKVVQGSITSLQHGAVTAVDNTTSAVNTSKDAVVASQGIAQGFISGAVRTSGGNVANTTARGASNITTQSIGNASRIVGAIASNRPIVNTSVQVYVTGAAVTKSVKTQASYGPGSGSAGNDAGRIGGKG